MYKNPFSSILNFFGWFILLGSILVFPLYCILQEDILGGFLLILVSFITSIFIFGFASVINLLHNNNKNQETIIELLNNLSKE